MSRAGIALLVVVLGGCAELAGLDAIAYVAGSVDNDAGPSTDGREESDAAAFGVLDASPGAGGDAFPGDSLGMDAIDAARESDAKPAPPCDGGPVYTHHAGVEGVTWQDCVPTGTFNEGQATAACSAFAIHTGCSSGVCQPPSNQCSTGGGNSNVLYLDSCSAREIIWKYAHCTAPGTVNVSGSCLGTQDPAWD